MDRCQPPGERVTHSDAFLTIVERAEVKFPFDASKVASASALVVMEIVDWLPISICHEPPAQSHLNPSAENIGRTARQRSFHSTSCNALSLTAHATHTTPFNLLICLTCRSHPSCGRRRISCPAPRNRSHWWSWRLSSRGGAQAQAGLPGASGFATFHSIRLPGRQERRIS